MGMFKVTCSDGCSCEEATIDSWHSAINSQVGIAATLVMGLKSLLTTVFGTGYSMQQQQQGMCASRCCQERMVTIPSCRAQRICKARYGLLASYLSHGAMGESRVWMWHAIRLL